MTSRIAVRGYQAGFLFVVALLAATTAFTLWGELRTNDRVNVLVEQALERAALIGRIRVDAVSLEQAVDGHIRAQDDAGRQAADEEMAEILDDIHTASTEYTEDLPHGQRMVWQRFNQTCQSMADQVRSAVKWSNKKQAERARAALEQKVRPLTSEVDDLAAQLSQENADQTHRLLTQIEDLRLRNTGIGVGVALLALLISLVVGAGVTRVLRNQEDTIAQQLLELDRRNKELDAFASRVAHDLVSPLGPLKGYLTLIRRSGAIADPAVMEMLLGVESSAQRVSDLVEALLRFCRAGKQGEAQVAELDTAVMTLLLEVDQVAAREKVVLERAIEDKVFVGCPLQLLQSVAQNLLSNAVKYTAGKPEAKVTVRVLKEKGEAVLEVTDNGPGMSEETQRQLFQPFFRARETLALPGHGLGLATTKRIVDAYGGNITVRSALGAGTQVTVRFPLSSGQPPKLSAEPQAAA